MHNAYNDRLTVSLRDNIAIMRTYGALVKKIQ